MRLVKVCMDTQQQPTTSAPTCVAGHADQAWHASRALCQGHRKEASTATYGVRAQAPKHACALRHPAQHAMMAVRHAPSAHTGMHAPATVRHARTHAPHIYDVHAREALRSAVLVLHAVLHCCSALLCAVKHNTSQSARCSTGGAKQREVCCRAERNVLLGYHPLQVRATAQRPLALQGLDQRSDSAIQRHAPSVLCVAVALTLREMPRQQLGRGGGQRLQRCVACVGGGDEALAVPSTAHLRMRCMARCMAQCVGPCDADQQGRLQQG